MHSPEVKHILLVISLFKIFSISMAIELILELSFFLSTDLVCQSGPGSWPSSVYAQSAMYPMANSAAQVYPLFCASLEHSILSTGFHYAQSK